MDRKERLATAFDGAVADRPPILGGWLAAPGHIQTLTGCTQEEYWGDPVTWGLQAEQVLGSDGVITVFVSVSEGEYRCVDQRVLDRRARYDVDSVLAEIEAQPDVEEIRARFDEESAYAAFIAEFQQEQERCGDMLWRPADWSMIPKALWYHEYGYEVSVQE